LPVGVRWGAREEEKVDVRKRASLAPEQRSTKRALEGRIMQIRKPTVSAKIAGRKDREMCRLMEAMIRTITKMRNT